jgi:hypothetical protein
LLGNMRDALRLLGDSRDQFCWLCEQITLRLLRRVEERLTQSPQLGLDADAKAELHVALGAAFEEVLGGLEASL